MFDPHFSAESGRFLTSVWAKFRTSLNAKFASDAVSATQGTDLHQIWNNCTVTTNPEPALRAQSALKPTILKNRDFSRTILGICMSTVLAVGVGFGVPGTVIAYLILAIFFIPGWPHLLDLTNRHAPRLILGLTTVACAAAAAFGSVEQSALVAVGAVMASFVGEMLRKDGRIRLVEQISGTIAGVMVLVAGSMWIHLAKIDVGTQITICIAISIAVAALILSFKTPNARPVAVFNSIVFAAGTSLILGFNVFAGIFAGAGVGMSYLLVRRSLANEPADTRLRAGISRTLLPHLVLGIIGYVTMLMLGS